MALGRLPHAAGCLSFGWTGKCLPPVVSVWDAALLAGSANTASRLVFGCLVFPLGAVVRDDQTRDDFCAVRTYSSEIGRSAADGAWSHGAQARP